MGRLRTKQKTPNDGGKHEQDRNQTEPRKRRRQRLLLMLREILCCENAISLIKDMVFSAT